MDGLLYRSVQGGARALGRAFIAVIAVSLVACGGGGSGGDKRPPSPLGGGGMGGDAGGGTNLGDTGGGTTPGGTTSGGTTPGETTGGGTAPGGTTGGGTIPGETGGGAIVVVPQSPQLTLNARAIKTFRFSWPAVNGATEYRLLEDPDGDSEFNPTPIATIPAPMLAHERTVFLPSRMNAQYALMACNSAGCSPQSDPAKVTPSSLTAAIGYVKPSNTVADLGATPAVQARNKVVALSADGKTLAFSSLLEDSAGQGVMGTQTIISNDRENNSGAVYILVNNDGIWSQQAYIKASDSRPDLFFGMSVALSADGNTLAVGATEQTLGRATTITNPRGAVYVFSRNGTTWMEQSPILRASNPGVNDFFGFSVVLAGDGKTLAVGATLEDGPDNGTMENSGAVYVFTRSDSGFDQPPVYLKARNTGASDLFGGSVSLSFDGQTLIVGASSEDSKPGSGPGDDAEFADSGAAYVFVRNGMGWTEQAMLKAFDGLTNAGFGSNISLSGDGTTLAIGAGQAGIMTTTGPGAVYIFLRADSSSPWIAQQPALRAAVQDNGDSFVSVGLSDDGRTLVVGALGESSKSKGLEGNEIGSSDQQDNSAPRSGAAYIFTRSGTNFAQLAYLKASNTGANDGFGFSVAIAGDGSTVAVMAPSEDSSAIGVGGNQNDESATGSGGAVYLY